ncbi:hypothetical protein OB236_30470 [Paenibacillus sp. WQ 127069]|uniref:Phospholipase C/D domain-containing protein n=1 Tax=Paenibacillus baimaensis TaxID=2982185 RepID=A0ABT2UP84_9BACL|nr:hypothetical protein [Paenibacillus sp. WQ 127069]MCU6796458.1 hypothetical protein [Paenibacillus sp. WQ 127069]
MSENVTHTAVVEDCFNMMFAAEHICKAFKEAGRDHIQFSQFGSVTRSGDKFTVALLDKYRTNWDARKEEDNLGYKLAFVLGWLCHRAADRQMKVVFREAEPESRQFPTDCSIYHDAFIFHRLYENNNNTPFPYQKAHFEINMESLKGSGAINVHAAADTFRFIWQRQLLELQTFVPDTEHIDNWFDKLHAKHQEQTIHLDRYAEAVLTPDPDKVKRFIEDTNFYNEEDAIIQLSQALRQGAKPSQEELTAAFAAEPTSQYAHAVKMGYGYLQSASAYFTGEIDQDTLKDQLDVGKKGRDGQSV